MVSAYRLFVNNFFNLLINITKFIKIFQKHLVPEVSDLHPKMVAELQDLFRQSGLEVVDFYYPYPDYKFPRCIYTDDYLPKQGDCLELASNYTSMRRKYFDETRFLKSLRPEEYKLFANSYLICVRKAI